MKDGKKGGGWWGKRKREKIQYCTVLHFQNMGMNFSRELLYGIFTVHTDTHAHTLTHARMHTYKHTYAHIHVYSYTYASMHMHTNA